jgi:methyl-accepting chemotaxis protein PixJ
MTLEPSISLTEIVRNTQQQKELISEIFNKIRPSENQEDIFKTAAEIIHKTLQCDRIVIYSLQDQSQGKIIAEAVTPGFAQIINTVIKDSCFETRYADKYQKGRVRAISDIHQAGLESCHVEELVKIDVKANLVVPLIDSGNQSLYGLLVAHHCSQVYQWQQSEINLMLQVADWMMEQINNQQKYQQLEEKLYRFSQWQKSLTATTKNIHAGLTTSETLQTTVEKAKDFLNCDRVIIYGLNNHNSGKIVAESTVSALAPILGSIIQDPCFKYRYIDKYQQGRVRAITNIYEAGMSRCYIENLEKIGVKSNLVVPINWDNGEIYGLLVAHQCFAFREWQSQEIEWLKQVGIQTGLSLSKAKLREQLEAIHAGFLQLETARDTITITKSEIKGIQQILKNAWQVMLEMNNLNKLLEREINTINQTGSMQTKKETKLIQIIIKKLSVNTVKLRTSFGLFVNKSRKIEKLLEKGAVGLYNNVVENELNPIEQQINSSDKI